MLESFVCCINSDDVNCGVCVVWCTWWLHYR